VVSTPRNFHEHAEHRVSEFQLEHPANRLGIGPHLLHLHGRLGPRRRLGLEQDRVVLEPEPRAALLDLGGRPAPKADRIEEGRSWLWVENGTILFKAEASAWTPSAVQLQQVWVDPEARRMGNATRGLSDLCRLLLDRTPVVCLFVRPENGEALGLYEKIGMRQEGTYRSVLF
jgi:predicted GNAT family acetyltransferase